MLRTLLALALLLTLGSETHAYLPKQGIDVNVTAYYPCREQGWGDGTVTYSGKRPRRGMISISHDLLKKHHLKMGDRVRLKGYGTFVVEDLMHHRWRKRVDILYTNRRAAKKFGLHKTTLTLSKDETLPISWQNDIISM